MWLARKSQIQNELEEELQQQIQQEQAKQIKQLKLKRKHQIINALESTEISMVSRKLVFYCLYLLDCLF